MEWRGTEEARQVLDIFRDEYFSERGLKQRMSEDGVNCGRRDFFNLGDFLNTVNPNWMMGVKGGLQLSASIDIINNEYNSGREPSGYALAEFEKHLAQSRLPTRFDLLDQRVPVEEIPSF